jgi:hypothetical protein
MQRLLRDTMILSIVLLTPLWLLITLYWPASLDYYFYAQLLTLFSDQFWSGDLYPRWLTAANAGAGSPSFVFFHFPTSSGRVISIRAG